MSEQITTAKPQRLVSLDAFRGITIAGMILVNNPGSWGRIYPPLGHAHWDGWTPTDLVFPFFLFIVGVAMTFSFNRRLEKGGDLGPLFAQIIRRTIILFALGLIMYSFGNFLKPWLAGGYPELRLISPYVLLVAGLGFVFADMPLFSFGSSGAGLIRKLVGLILLVSAVVCFYDYFGYFQEVGLRIPGVLQRIAVCYFVASLIMMAFGVWGQAACALILVVGYWLIVAFVQAPAGFEADVVAPIGLLHHWIDVSVLGNHLYGQHPDPEGILSTLPAIATTLLGGLTGHWLQTARDSKDKLVGLFLAANVALVVGLCMNYGFAINKKIWSSSYVIFTAGLALHFLAMCYWLIDIKGVRKPAWPFVVFGSNAIVVYVASTIMAIAIGRAKITLADGGSISVKSWIYQNWFASWAGEWNGSLFFALAYVTLWLLPMIVLYKKKIFVKV